MIVKVKDGAYEEYEQLLLKRDHFRKAAAQMLIAYTKEFGDLVNAVFEKKIACIRLKKSIAAAQAYINRGEPVDVDKMNERIEKEMTMYYAQLAEMLEHTRAAKDSREVPAAAMVEIRRLYRKLARLLHPDINPETGRSPELMDLWNRIVIAYQNNDLEELHELEVLALSAAGPAGEDVQIPDIEEKIDRLEREINEIVSSEPYTYKAILEDAGLTEERKASLQEELEEYETYRQSLERTLEAMLTEAGGRTTWRMT